MNGNQPTPERIMQLATGGWVAGILGAAASHSLFTHLEAGANTADKLAAQAGISERGAQTLLDGLVGLGLVELRAAITAIPPKQPPSWSKVGRPA
jgi:methyltransferase family protein